MIFSVKHYFIPHAGNNHRPYFLRNNSMRGLAGFVILAEILILMGLTVGVTGNFSNTAAVLPGVLGALANDERGAAHLTPLVENPVLDSIATLKAEDMARKSYFSHTSPEGLTPWYWFRQAGYDYEYAGENLAIDFKDSYDVTHAWMNSPAHRANIIKSAYTEMGTGVASGTYDGVPTVFVAQVYAKPAVKKVTEQMPLSKAKVIPLVEKSTTSPAVSNVIAIKPQILGATSETVVIQPSLWHKMVTSPRRFANIFFSIIALGVVLSLGIHIFIKKDARHVDLVLNGLVLIALIIAVCIVNKAVADRTMTSFQAFDSQGVVTVEK